MGQIGWILLATTGFTVGACSSHEPLPDSDSDTSVSGASPPLSGQTAYDNLCASCHEEGLDGAPATGDAAAWANRSPLWMAVLAEHAKSGYLQMPARGGGDGLSDADVEAATDHMLSLTYPDRPRD